MSPIQALRRRRAVLDGRTIFFLARAVRIADLAEVAGTLPVFAANVPRVVPIERATLMRRPCGDFATGLLLFVLILRLFPFDPVSIHRIFRA